MEEVPGGLTGKLVYFAGPLFNPAERRFNAALASRIEALGLRVFLPQRDGIESDAALSPADRQAAIFALDRDKVLESDIFLFVADGRVPDEGACVELGIAYAQKRLQRPGKLLVGLHTDQRAAFAGSRLNEMIAGALDHLFTEEADLLDFLRR